MLLSVDKFSTLGPFCTKTNAVAPFPSFRNQIH